jgi:diaminohydroxyphosphoribosylaminopyrimidine deaminase/5-amino-6-(5-phosphoribosylamino)uracil reductase
MSFSEFDRNMMEIALALARRGWGTAAPNPSVGAVIADPSNGVVLACGWTQPGGRPHAETEALRRAGARALGATLYVTLEPCAHHGKTPPCADAVIAAGLARVVVGIEDPDPRTRGQGMARLAAAGVAVEAGLCADAARWVTRGHILRISERRPFVQLKMALACDGTVPRGGDGQPLMVTGPEARAMAHRLRAEADAILIGAGTARDDDPELSCRLPGLERRSPIRVVLSRMLNLPSDLKLVRSAREVPTWIFTAADKDGEGLRALERAGVRIFQAPSPPIVGEGVAAWPVEEVLSKLADEGVTRLLVEGGAATWAAFSAAGLADEVVVFQAGAGGDDGDEAAALAVRHAPGLDLAPAEARRLGADRMTILRAVRAARG